MGTQYYSENGTYVIVKDGHVQLLSEKEFRTLQINEIRNFQDELGKRDNKTAAMWIQQNAKQLRERLSPIIFQNSELKQSAFHEIQKHRWIESEKAGQDLGVSAEIDWLEKFRKIFHQQSLK